MSTKIQVEDIVNNMNEGVYVTDRDRIIRYWNRGAERLTGFSRVETMWHSCKDGILSHVDENGVSLCENGCPLLATLDDGVGREADVFLHHKDGQRVPVHISVAPIRDKDGNIIAVAETFHDSSAMFHAKETIATLERLSMIDALTSLPNRRFLDFRLEQRLEELVRYGWSLWVFIADVDCLDKVNHDFGHDAGDRVIKMVGSALTHCFRVSDIVGRLGGGQFLGILTVDDPAEIKPLGDRARTMVEKSFLLADGKNLGATVSMGFAQAQQGDNMDSLLKRADACLQESKLAGKNRITVYPLAA